MIRPTEIRIHQLMRPFIEKGPSERTLKFKEPITLLNTSGKIVGLTIPPLGKYALVKVTTNYFGGKPTNHLYSLGNFDDSTLELILTQAKKSMALLQSPEVI